MSIKRIAIRSLYVFAALIIVLVLLFFLLAQEHTPLHLTRTELSKIVELAEKGDADACWVLSYYYMEEEDKELYWVRKGVNYGDPRAKYSLYNIIKSRRIVIEGIDALFLLNEAAEQNFKNAQMELARIYREEKNLDKAEYWFRRASNLGSEFAMEDLSKTLLTRYRDYDSIVEAYKWVTISLMRDPNKNSGFAARDRKIQDEIIKRAKSLGFNTVKLRQDAEKEALAEDKKIPIELNPVDEMNIRLEKVLSKIKK